jgi:hypothetical protein
MATLRTRHYETEIDHEVIFNRIFLDAEPVSDLVDPWFYNKTEDTSKPWVGIIDRQEGTFELVQTNAAVIFPMRFLEGNFFTIFIEGQVNNNQSTRSIEVRYRLGWFTALFQLLTYLFPICFAILFAFQEEWDKLTSFIPWVLMFCVFPTILLIVQLNRIENEIADLLGVGHELRRSKVKE